MKSVLNKLAEVSNRLDVVKATTLSDRLDSVMFKIAELILEPNEDDFESIEDYQEAYAKYIENKTNKEDEDKYFSPYLSEKLDPNDFEYLDRGAYSTIWMHKNLPHFIMKNSPQEQGNKDFEVIRYIEKIKPKLKPETIKHLPKYLVINDKDESAIIEKLLPIDEKTRAALFSRKKIKDLVELDSGKHLKAVRSIIPGIAFEIYNKVPKLIISFEEIHDLVEKYMLGQIKSADDVIDIILNKIKKSDIKINEIQFRMFLQTLLDNSQTLPIVPLHYTDDYYSALTEDSIEELRSAILDLKANGLGWADLHGENLMIRPGTGELVLSDLGQFQILK